MKENIKSRSAQQMCMIAPGCRRANHNTARNNGGFGRQAEHADRCGCVPATRILGGLVWSNIRIGEYENSALARPPPIPEGKKGRTHGKKEGRKDGRREIRMDGSQSVSKKGKERRTDEQTERMKDARESARKPVRKQGRKCQSVARTLNLSL
jgi:hypothetical protein